MRSLFIIITTYLLTGTSFSLNLGEEVSLEALSSTSFLKGEAPKKWEKDHVYIIECWATWCGPCLSVIPHIDNLYDTYKDKGLHVIGMNVLEDNNKEGVLSFIKKQGDGMSYPVAFMEEGSAFAQQWYEAAGVQGIPHSFVIKEGKLLFQGHPASLTEEVIKKLLNPETDLDALVESFKKENEVAEKSPTIANKYFSAKEEGNEESMKAAIEEAKLLDEKFHQFLLVNYSTAKERWDDLREIFKNNPPEINNLAVSFLIESDPIQDIPADLFSLVEPHIEVNIPGFTAILQSRINTKSGNKEDALKYAQKALKEVKDDGRIPAGPFEKFIKSLEEEKSMTISELEASIQEESAQ